MKIGILGTGMVGEAIGSALIAKGHNVMMGSRQAGNEKGKAWAKKAGDRASEGSFGDATAFGEVIFLALNGEYALGAIDSVDAASFNNKIVIDITNPLNFTKGLPPSILDDFRDVSLGEQIQERIPGAYVVKALNTINYKLMVDARIVNNGNHNLFICGNDINAKNQAKHFMVDNFHWKPEALIDLGDIKAARCTEAIVPFWVLVWQTLGTPQFNFKVVQ